MEVRVPRAGVQSLEDLINYLSTVAMFSHQSGKMVLTLTNQPVNVQPLLFIKTLNWRTP